MAFSLTKPFAEIDRDDTILSARGRNDGPLAGNRITPGPEIVE